MPSWDRLFIGGQWVEPSSSSTIEVISPYTTEVVGTTPEAMNADVDRAVTAANAAFDGWAQTPVAERAAVLRRLLDGYAARMDEMADLITSEMGSPTSFAKIAQAPIAWMTLSTFLGYTDSYPWEEQRQGAFGNVVVRREPVGVVAAIVPWNVPQFVTMTKLAPALLAGCPVVLKPAPETPLNAFVLAEIAEAAGLPAGLLNVCRPDVKSASTSSVIPASTRSRSPARLQPAERSPRSAASSSSVAASSSAASRHRSCSTAQTSKRSPTACASPRS